MDALTMPPTEGAADAYELQCEAVAPLKPALASIKAACDYMGGISRAKFYADLLPLLETVKLGSRNFIVVESIDRLIEAHRKRPIDNQNHRAAADNAGSEGGQWGRQ